MYTIRAECLSGEVDDIFTYIILTFYGKTSAVASEIVMHRKGLQKTVILLLKFGGVNFVTST